ncbi:MAG: hypothetical protein H0W39_03420, partial [Sphingomonas sp.]|nr:hypothetical protein [Sphingomonas sp.]
MIFRGIRRTFIRDVSGQVLGFDGGAFGKGAVDGTTVRDFEQTHTLSGV